MEKMDYQRLTLATFSEHALDSFERDQEVQECWRQENGEWVLRSNPFTEQWDLPKCRQVASSLRKTIAQEGIAFGAFCKGEVIGFVQLGHERFVPEERYQELVMMQVSRPWRRFGVGRRLFSLACQAAKEAGAKRLYISAHSSKESQAFYRSVGCVPTSWIHEQLAKDEPFDVQMECLL